MGRKNNISGTKKADSNAGDFLFEIKIIKTSLSSSSELQTATGALSGFLRAAKVATYTPATPTPRGLGAKLDDISETIKIFEKKIADWSKKPIENEYALLLFILCHLPHETSKNKSYYVVEENGNYRIRFSGHNALAKYLSRNEKYKVGITFQSKDDPITFRPQYDVFYKEFVYYREYLASDILRDILQGIVDVLKGGYYNAPCDLPLYSPSEQRYKQHFDMQKDNKQYAKKLQGLDGIVEIHYLNNKTKIGVISPYNSAFVSKAHDLNGKWGSFKDKNGVSHKCWIFDISEEKEVKDALFKIYGSTGEKGERTVTLLVKNFSDRNYQSSVTFFGIEVARAFGNNSSAKLGSQIIWLEGYKHGTGSRKNWYTEVSDATFKIKDVPIGLLENEDLKKQIEEGKVEVLEEEPKPQPKYKVGDWFQTDDNLISYFKVIEPYITDSQVFYKVATYNINLYVINPLTSCKESDLDAFKKLPEQPKAEEPKEHNDTTEHTVREYIDAYKNNGKTFKDFIVDILAINGYKEETNYTITFYKSSPYHRNRGHENIQEVWLYHSKSHRGFKIDEEDYEDESTLERITDAVCSHVDINFDSKHIKFLPYPEQPQPEQPTDWDKDDPNYFDAEELKRRLAEDNGETGEMLLDMARVIIHGTGTKVFAEALADRYNMGEKFDWTKAKKMAEPFGIKSQQELMQACELGVVLAARQIAHKDASLAERFASMRDLYEQQVTIRPLDTQSKFLQQYSTPCPLAFLLGEYVKHRQDIVNATYLEPTAGNGMLTIALDADKTTVNELDEIRYKNLHAQPYNAKLNKDANKLSLPNKYFDGVITNPPFAKLADSEKISRNGWAINTLDYKLSVLALDKMKDTGRAAIIIGGKMWNNYWKPLNERSEKKVLFGQWKTFLGYLYAQYNVVDVIYVNGDNIYRKQGTQYPIVAILIGGRHEYNEANKPNYVFDPERDVIIDTYDQLFDRMMKHLAKEADDDRRRIAKAKAKALMLYTYTQKSDNSQARAHNLLRGKDTPQRGDVYTLPKTWARHDAWLSNDEKDAYDFYSVADVSGDKVTVINESLMVTSIYTLEQFKKMGFKFHHYEDKYGTIGGIDDYTKYQNFIKKALNTKIIKSYECTELISEHSRKKINRLINKNIYKYYLTAHDLRHIRNRQHLTEEEFMRIPEVLAYPTDIELMQNDLKYGQGVRFLKTYPDGSQYCLMVDLYENNNLSLKTGYKKPLGEKPNGYTLYPLDDLSSPNITSETHYEASKICANVTNFFRIQ